MRTIEVTHKGVTIKIKQVTTKKRGVPYTEYQIADYSTKKRVRHSRANLPDAKAKAKEICAAIADRKTETLQFKDRHWDDVRCAAEVLAHYDLTLPEAAHLLASALGTGVCTDELLVACQHWIATRPNKPFTPKLITEVAKLFMATQRRMSERRLRTLQWYVDVFVAEFGDRWSHDIIDTEIQDFLDHRQWSPKTTNEWLNGIGLLYKEAQFRGFVPPDYNPCAKIKRLRLTKGNIGIYYPAQVIQILDRVREDLLPFLVIWFFMGARKDEIARLKWPQVRSALLTGYLHIEPEQGKKTGERTSKVMPNLRAWMEWYLARHPDADGFVLPRKYNEGRQLDDVTRKIANDSKLAWVANGPRHSFCTFHLTKFKDAPELVKNVGNSFRQLEKHYWNKSRAVVPQMADEYFAILPTRKDNESGDDTPEPESESLALGSTTPPTNQL